MVDADVAYLSSLERLPDPGRRRPPLPVEAEHEGGRGAAPADAAQRALAHRPDVPAGGGQLELPGHGAGRLQPLRGPLGALGLHDGGRRAAGDPRRRWRRTRATPRIGTYNGSQFTAKDFKQMVRLFESTTSGSAPTIPSPTGSGSASTARPGRPSRRPSSGTWAGLRVDWPLGGPLQRGAAHAALHYLPPAEDYRGEPEEGSRSGTKSWSGPGGGASASTGRGFRPQRDDWRGVAIPGPPHVGKARKRYTGHEEDRLLYLLLGTTQFQRHPASNGVLKGRSDDATNRVSVHTSQTLRTVLGRLPLPRRSVETLETLEAWCRPTERCWRCWTRVGDSKSVIRRTRGQSDLIGLYHELRSGYPVIEGAPIWLCSEPERGRFVVLTAAAASGTWRASCQPVSRSGRSPLQKELAHDTRLCSRLSVEDTREAVSNPNVTWNEVRCIAAGASFQRREAERLVTEGI